MYAIAPFLDADRWPDLVFGPGGPWDIAHRSRVAAEQASPRVTEEFLQNLDRTTLTKRVRLLRAWPV